MCSCGMGAVAQCTDCARPLCGVDLVRRDGQVLCADDVRTRKKTADDTLLRATLDRLTRHAEQYGDPADRAFVLHLSRDQV